MAGRSLMHNIGSFFGEIVKGFASRPDKDATRYEIHRDAAQGHRAEPDGNTVTLRRTTVEEIEYTTTPRTESDNT